MEKSETNGLFETQADIDRVLEATGVSADQMNRWRREGLLPPVEQVPVPYSGSEIRYPVGTCEQIRAASALFAEKHRMDFVGWQLFLAGYPVAEKHWKPSLRSTAKFLDKVRPILVLLTDRYNRREETLADKTGAMSWSGLILSRVERRVSVEERPTIARVLLETAQGEFEGFEFPERDGERSYDELAMIKALDLRAAETDKILGISPKYVEALPFTLRDISQAMREGSFQKDVDGPSEALLSARCDVVNTLTIAKNLYAATEWIFGKKALGLRMMNWIALKRPVGAVEAFILLFVRLRRIPDSIHSSEDIAAMAAESELVAAQVREIQRLQREDPRFRKVFSAPRIRLALTDEAHLRLLLKEVLKARLSSS
jgi:hypothetical protein